MIAPLDVTGVVLLIASGCVAVSALGATWLLFRNGAALWKKLGEPLPDPKLEAWNRWAAEQGVSNPSIGSGSGGASFAVSSSNATSDSWGFADALSLGGGSSLSDSSSASDSSGSASDSFSGGGGGFGGGGADGDY